MKLIEDVLSDDLKFRVSRVVEAEMKRKEIEKARAGKERRLLRDGGLNSIREVKGSLLVTLSRSLCDEEGIEKGDELPIVPVDEEGVVAKIGDPED